jgi:hypothetical protein
VQPKNSLNIPGFASPDKGGGNSNSLQVRTSRKTELDAKRISQALGQSSFDVLKIKQQNKDLGQGSMFLTDVKIPPAI